MSDNSITTDQQTSAELSELLNLVYELHTKGQLTQQEHHNVKVSIFANIASSRCILSNYKQNRDQQDLKDSLLASFEAHHQSQHNLHNATSSSVILWYLLVHYSN
jgi:hypothetical protein